jgi:argininosuccinate lyase
MVQISRLAEELGALAEPDFGFIGPRRRFCTGSSIMPQKKNPDVPELRAGKDGPGRRPSQLAAGR